ncbi:MAG: Flp pilus assembly protein CpaB [Caulobacteraceae bacterium]|nr:Flp pilus assembly protein CpaB [Caulobacteraceae bacterium]
MNPSRIAIIAVAGLAALVLAFLVHTMVSMPKSPVAAGPAAAPATTRVLTAKQDLAVGDRLSGENMTWQSWPATTLNAAYITDGSTEQAKPSGAAGAVKQASFVVGDMATGGGPKMQSMVGAIVREPIYAGEPITAAKIVRSSDSGYMAVRLPAGMRAMSVPVTVESGAGGFIQPGDHVDIVSSHPDTAHNGQGGTVAETILANVKVLAVDQHTDTPKNATSLPGATLTLEVPADNVEGIARARSGGQLMMALRSYADIAGETSSSSNNHAVRIFRGGGPAEVVTTQ